MTIDRKSLIEGIAPPEGVHEKPLKRDFRAWHKPRKQWVREEQWCHEATGLIQELRPGVERLRYLSLPGEDMLDIRVLANVCMRQNVRLRCLGFDETASGSTEVNLSSTEVHISSNEVSNIVEPGSIVLDDEFSSLANLNSQGFRYLADLGPFDLVNLDLCRSVSCVNDRHNHQAIKNLCEYQVNNTRNPWLLFLTTRADFAMVNTDHLPHYLDSLRSNANTSSAFSDRFLEITKFDLLCTLDPEEIRQVLSGHDGENFVKLFAAGFSKWLLRLLINAPAAWHVEMLNSFWYRVEENQFADSFPNMLSLAFRIAPVHLPLADPSSLATTNPGPEIDEVRTALGLLESTDNFVDLDKIVDRDEDLFDRLTAASSQLLEAARYQIDEYPSWAQKKRIRFMGV